MGQKAEENNADRASRAERVIRHYSRTPGYSGEVDHDADITDLLTDLRHFCTGAELDFEEMVRRSKLHYEAERKEEASKGRRAKPAKEPVCPSCGSRLECDPDQDGACDWRCPNCGWRQHVPAPGTQAKKDRKEESCRTRRDRRR